MPSKTDRTREPLWKSCCRGRGCAEVAFDDEGILIRDHHGGLVRLTIDEYIEMDLIVRSEWRNGQG